MPHRLGLAALASLVLSVLGCPGGPIGTYRVDAAALLAASCNGAPQSRVQAWSDALTAAPASRLLVGRLGPSEAPQLQLLRDDASSLWAGLAEAGEAMWSGERTAQNTTTAEAGLGADFSALLETNGICTFDLAVGADLAGRDGDFAVVDSTVVVTISEADGGEPCAINVCTAEIRVAAVRTSEANPGAEE